MNNNNWDEFLACLGAIILIIALATFSIWWTVYKYQDCKRVGHTKTYCILDIGN